MAPNMILMPILTQAVGADKGELYVTEIPQKKEHFNLYYIYKEDKQRNILPAKTVAEICNTILVRCFCENNVDTS